MYGYIHDQALRLLNKGYIAAEIAEHLELPPSLEHEWHCRGYYGSLNHNLKAVYQRYLGWFDGNPAHLWPHPPVAAGERYAAAEVVEADALEHPAEPVERLDVQSAEYASDVPVGAGYGPRRLGVRVPSLRDPCNSRHFDRRRVGPDPPPRVVHKTLIRVGGWRSVSRSR